VCTTFVILMLTISANRFGAHKGWKVKLFDLLCAYYIVILLLPYVLFVIYGTALIF